MTDSNPPLGNSGTDRRANDPLRGAPAPTPPLSSENRNETIHRPVEGCPMSWEASGPHPKKRARNLLRCHLTNGHGLYGRRLAVSVSDAVVRMVAT